jgi:hypothetical protein
MHTPLPLPALRRPGRPRDGFGNLGRGPGAVHGPIRGPGRSGTPNSTTAGALRAARLQDPAGTTSPTRTGTA